MSADRPNWTTAPDVRAWLGAAFPKADPASLICVNNALTQIQEAGHIGDLNEFVAAQMLAAAQEVLLVQVTRGNALMSARGGDLLARATVTLLKMSPEERAVWANPTTDGAQRTHRRLLRFSGNSSDNA